MLFDVLNTEICYTQFSITHLTIVAKDLLLLLLLLFAYAWISQVAHARELMRGSTSFIYLFIYFVVVLLLSSSASSFFLLGVDWLFWQERYTALFRQERYSGFLCRRGRLPFLAGFFPALWWYCMHVWGLQWRSICVLWLSWWDKGRR